MPAWFALVGAAIGAAAVPFALACGLTVALVWPKGAWGKALAVVGGAVSLLVLTGATAGIGGALFMLFALAGNGLLALVIYGIYRWLFGPGIDPHYGARWAEQGDTADMVVEEGRHPGEDVLLAEHYGELIGVGEGFEGRREMGHFLVCGPSRSGKGLHLTSNLLPWLGSAIVNDIKGELYRLTARERETKGQAVYVLDPKGRGNRYDPFRELSYSPEALRSAVMVVMEPEKERQPIFAQRAANALYAAVLGARIEGRPTLPYVREITSEGAVAFVERLSRPGRPGDQARPRGLPQLPARAAQAGGLRGQGVPAGRLGHHDREALAVLHGGRLEDVRGERLRGLGPGPRALHALPHVLGGGAQVHGQGVPGIGARPHDGPHPARRPRPGRGARAHAPGARRGGQDPHPRDGRPGQHHRRAGDERPHLRPGPRAAGGRLRPLRGPGDKGQLPHPALLQAHRLRHRGAREPPLRSDERPGRARLRHLRGEQELRPEGQGARHPRRGDAAGERGGYRLRREEAADPGPPSGVVQPLLGRRGDDGEPPARGPRAADAGDRLGRDGPPSGTGKPRQAERQAPPSGASRLRRRRRKRREEREVEGGEEVGGYVEPEL